MDGVSIDEDSTYEQREGVVNVVLAVVVESEMKNKQLYDTW